MFCRVFVDGHRSYQSDGHFDSNLLVGLQPVIAPELVGTVSFVHSAGTDHAPEPLCELSRFPVTAFLLGLLGAPPFSVRGISNPHQKPDQQRMAALRDLTSVANATLEAAEDIPVPYYPDQEPKTDWMAMKLEAVEDFLREQEVYSPSIRRTQPNPEPATATSTAKGKERAQSPAVKTESATACDPTTTPAVPALPTDHAPFVNLAARAETLHLSPHTSSIEYLDSRHPDATDGDDSTNDEPSASKRPRLVSPTPSPPAPSPDYLALTPSEIDRLLHDARPFRYRFVYTPDHIRGIADDILRELSAFLSFYAPASEQEAAARIYLYRAFQSHFNRRL
ncbi:hypothetical protein PCASD_18725 [Puccinia coronata f. sp. avenae]|uniref:Uncharacterized protein n=1 Tax=Puccinia coronata f. sp. avenae TaxID=200324 RepID=A0A2N5TVK5_9BASI|nr:hypothetical protein PCASD_18725 [Puccinia coronata f. sp. avenae]